MNTEERMPQMFFEARDLWNSQVPYYEPDKITPLGGVRREMFSPTIWNARFGMSVDATPFFAPPMAGSFGLAADAEVVTP
jgi:hypothetical protein